MNFARHTVDAADPYRLAFVERARHGGRREWTFGEVVRAARALAARLRELGVRRGDVVMTLVGNRPDWVSAMVACFRQGHVVLPYTEQLRPKDLRLRLDVAQPAAVIADVRNERTVGESGWDGAMVWVPAELPDRDPGPPPELDPEDPCLITFTSGTAGEPKAVVHAQRYLTGQRLQAERWLDAGELVLDPTTVPTFFRGYLGGTAPAGPWRTGDRVTQDDDGFLFFEGRTDDVIISAGYRIGPFEVESALVEHPAVAEAAVVPAPDDERRAVVRAVIVLRDGHAPSDALARELQDHVKAQTAPYKYPRVVDFAVELPKTASGKIRRAALRR